MDHDELIDALGELSGRDVQAAIQFSDRTVDPIALLRGRLSATAGVGGRFEIGDGVIVVRADDLLDASWVEGLGEEPAVRIDLENVQITVSPWAPDMADQVD
jgi:hypothetical protein